MLPAVGLEGVEPSSMEPQSIALPLSYSPHAPVGVSTTGGSANNDYNAVSSHSMTSMLESGHRAWILSTILLT